MLIILSNMKTIDIAEILSPDLKSRMRAQDLKLLMENSSEDAFVLDFANVKFATRSFMDEFYNLFLKNPTVNNFIVKITNVPEDIKVMLDAVSRTQVNVTVVPSDTPEISFHNVDELLQYLETARL